jgi:2-dehydropantoate 2-reductase
MSGMRIAILGSGGVGGYFGARLAAAGAEVGFVARGAHLAAMRQRGLRIESPDGPLELAPVSATDDPAEIGPVDVVFFTVKLYDSIAALEKLPPLVGDRTVVIPFQNGVDSVDALTRAVGATHVAGGTTYVVSALAEPGVIRHTGLGRLVFGPLDPAQRPLLEQLLELCRAAGVDATLSDRIMADIWAKFVRLTAFSGMTSVTRSPVGVLLQDPDLWALTLAALGESLAVARARGIVLPASLDADIAGAMAAMPAESRSSMLEDLERGRPLELPWLSGAIVRLAAEAGVEVPTHRFIAAVLKPHVGGRRDRTRG